MLGIKAFGEARAFPYEKLVKDRLGGRAIILVVGPDGQSVRAFRAGEGDFYRIADGQGLMMDSSTGIGWNFQGCAIEGKARGNCLEKVELIADYWFDWRNYNPATTVYQKAVERPLKSARISPPLP